MRWFGNFGAKKNKSQQKGAVWHIMSNPLDPTRRTNEDPPIPSLYWQDFTSIKINGLESGKPFCHRPRRTSSTLKMPPSCQGILHHLNRPTMMSIMMSVRIPPTAEIEQASSSYWEMRDQHLYLFAFIIYESITFGVKT